LIQQVDTTGLNNRFKQQVLNNKLKQQAGTTGWNHAVSNKKFTDCLKQHVQTTGSNNRFKQQV